MGKRSIFQRIGHDYYPTPPEAVAPLESRLKLPLKFCEPCAGDGALVRALEAIGCECVSAFDLEPPDKAKMPCGNALEMTAEWSDHGREGVKVEVRPLPASRARIAA